MVFDLFYKQDFEVGSVLDDWDVSLSVMVFNGYNNVIFVIYVNIWFFNDFIVMEMLVLGFVEVNDIFCFDYCYVEYFVGIELMVFIDMDSLNVGVFIDCGEIYMNVFVVFDILYILFVDMIMVVFLLEEYVGEYICVCFQGIWGEGDYWLDIDNINICCCNVIMVDMIIIGVSVVDMIDGSIVVLLMSFEGLYIYEWSIGDFIWVVVNLGVGEYIVMIMDGFGCQDV